ncbi:MAG TPA: TraB/GumN family protein, partial [Alteromonas macleodii]|nr:TraB/GumN family protein [Alteromonas macleodii]
MKRIPLRKWAMAASFAISATAFAGNVEHDQTS